MADESIGVSQGSGAYEVNQEPGSRFLKATPVEGDFGGDFVRRNRSQLHHEFDVGRWSVTHVHREIWFDEVEHSSRVDGLGR